MKDSRVKGKLNSQAGASIVLALVYFLICATVGAVILAAAQASVSHVRKQRQTEARYLAVMSAAQLLKEELGSISGSWELDHGVKDEAADADMRIGFKQAVLGEIKPESSAKGLIRQQLLKEIYQAYLNNVDTDNGFKATIGGARKSTLTFQLPEDTAFSVPGVTAQLTITPDYGVLDSGDEQQLHFQGQAAFSLTNASNGQYYMTMDFSGVVEYYLDEEVIETEETTTGADGNEVTTVTTTYQYTSSAVISLDEPALQGGQTEGGGG